MIYLSAKDIAALADREELMGAIEDALLLREKGNFVMPDRISIADGDQAYLYMPCFAGDLKGTKILSSYPGNRELGKPLLQGVMLLNDPNHGGISCILDGAALTAFRTGAVGGVGAKYTAPKNCTTLGVMGAGTQSFYQCLFISGVLPIRQIAIFDLAASQVESLKCRLEAALPGVEVIPCQSAEEVLRLSETIVTTTTARRPVFPEDENLLRGKHFIGIGSYKPEMREYPAALYPLLKQVYVDVPFAAEESGDVRTPLAEGWILPEQVYNASSLISRQLRCEDETTFFKSVGMALFDVCTANCLYQRALKLGIGQELA